LFLISILKKFIFFKRNVRLLNLAPKKLTNKLSCKKILKSQVWELLLLKKENRKIEIQSRNKY
jgi:hypothetical protein